MDDINGQAHRNVSISTCRTSKEDLQVCILRERTGDGMQSTPRPFVRVVETSWMDHGSEA